MYLRFAKVRSVTSPSRANPTDAGIDFFVPNDFEAGELDPKKSILIPSGIKVEIPFGYMGLFLNKSGIASKKKLLVGAQVVDTYYSGEVHIDLHNVGEDSILISPGDKIIQMTIVPIVPTSLQEVGEPELYKDFLLDNTRGEGGFGSTGSK